EQGIAPPILGTYAGEGYFTIVYQTIRGAELGEFIRVSGADERRRCAVAIAEKYARLAGLGIFWNDCRHHNVLIDERGEPFFIDFELAAFVELEDNRRRLLWMLWHLCHSQHGGLIPEAALLTRELPDTGDAQETECPE